MKRFEKYFGDDAAAQAKYDGPTIHYVNACAPSFKMKWTDFERKVSVSGVDVRRHAGIVSKAYDDMVETDVDGRDALDNVQRSVMWRERAANVRRNHFTKDAIPSRLYERRLNGYDEDVSSQTTQLG